MLYNIVYTYHGMTRTFAPSKVHLSRRRSKRVSHPTGRDSKDAQVQAWHQPRASLSHSLGKACRTGWSLFSGWHRCLHHDRWISPDKILLHISIISFPKGTTWMGENLREERKYCDLSLYFSNKELMEVLREGEGMETLVERWLDVSLKVSDRLTEVGKQFNSSKMWCKLLNLGREVAGYFPLNCRMFVLNKSWYDMMIPWLSGLFLAAQNSSIIYGEHWEGWRFQLMSARSQNDTGSSPNSTDLHLDFFF